MIRAGALGLLFPNVVKRWLEIGSVFRMTFSGLVFKNRIAKTLNFVINILQGYMFILITLIGFPIPAMLIQNRSTLRLLRQSLSSHGSTDSAAYRINCVLLKSADLPRIELSVSFG